LLALLHHLRPTAYTLLPLWQPMFSHPPGQPSSALVACAPLLEWTGSAGGRRIRAARAAQFDRGKAERESLACWTLVGIGRPILGEIIFAEEPKLLVG
jgi:hypothetical protein